MNQKITLTALLTLALALGGLAHADDADEDNGDAIAVVGEGMSAEQAAATIALPEEAADEAVEHAGFGIETANEARERAREDGRDFGEDVADTVRESELSEQLREDVSDAQSNDARP